jgi:hypothetical protein
MALIGDAAIHDHVIMSHARPQIKPDGLMTDASQQHERGIHIV